MPVPDTSGIPPFADFEAIKSKLNEIVAKYNNLLVNLDSLNVVSLTADHIDTGTIDAGKVTVRADLTGGAYIQIDSTDGLVINNGSYDTFKADINGNVTMTSALIQSASGYPKVVIDPSGNLFGAYLDANNYVEIGSQDSVSHVPYFLLFADGQGMEFIGDSSGVNWDILGDLFINASNVTYNATSIDIGSWTKLIGTSGSTLQAELDLKQNNISGYTGSFVSGTKTVTVSNGIITSVV